MPSINSMDLPKPQDAAEFEKMVREAYGLKWNSPNLQLNGRSGQAQAGVDVFGEDDLGRLTGIQCKLYAKGLTLKTVEADLYRLDLCLDLGYFGGYVDEYINCCTARLAGSGRRAAVRSRFGGHRE